MSVAFSAAARTQPSTAFVITNPSRCSFICEPPDQVCVDQQSIVPAQGIGPGFHSGTGRIQRLTPNEQQRLQVRFAQCVGTLRQPSVLARSFGPTLGQAPTSNAADRICMCLGDLDVDGLAFAVERGAATSASCSDWRINSSR